MPDYFESLMEKAKKKQLEQQAAAKAGQTSQAQQQPQAKKLEQALDQKMPGEKQMAKKLEELKMPEQAHGSRVHWVLESKKQQAETPSISQLEKTKKSAIAKYGEATIYRVEGSHLLHYEVPVPKPSSAEKAVINAIKEAATRLISISPYRIRDPQQKRNVYYQRIVEILQNNPELNIPSNRHDFYANAVVREMVGYGIIDPLISDDLLEEIMVIGPRKPVYVFHREFEMMTTNIEFYNDEEIQDLINRIAREVGRRVDISSPLLDARLPDGSRVNATIPPASVDESSLTIRKFRKDPYSLIDLVQLKTINLETAAFLWLCVEGMGTKPANILISGGTGSGKTTTLNALAALIPERERIVTIEDTAELALPLEHWIRLEARPPGLEGTGELTMDILTKNALRMRPDRIIVGEVRHAEAFTLFTALNTGHDGAILGNSRILFSNGKNVQISELVENYFKQKMPTKDGQSEFIELNEGVKVLSLNKQTLKTEEKEVTHVWRKKINSEIIKIELESGKTIGLTPDHPVYITSNGIQEISAGQIQKGQHICTPLQLTGEPNIELKRMIIVSGGARTAGELSSIINSDLAFEEVVLVEKEIINETVYDLTVKDNQNYVANGIIVSNCLGTLHANSPEETIVRVTNPPMNVPSTMLAALDLILVENRLHDKQRGTIRRVTEIAQVVGALEGEPTTRNIFVWNPITDSLERTAQEIDYIKKIQKFTGLEPKQIELELKRRERVLQSIQQKNIRNIQQVRTETNRFLENRGS